MSDAGARIAIDWGTTNRRALLIGADGATLDELSDDRGVLALRKGDYAGEIAALRARLGAVPVLAAGMVGSALGWHDVGYVDAPATLGDLATASSEVADGVVVVPGVCLHSPRPDVMRGEEVQVLGAVAAGLAPADALFCQPGTHNKWIETATVGGEAAIVDFTTAMTGELFALLRAKGTLAGMLDGEVADGAAFRDGLARGARADGLATALFEVRAAVVLERRPVAMAAAYASGILIGADVAARPDLKGREVHLLASGPLAPLYTAAIGLAGGLVHCVDTSAAFAAGASAIWERRP